MDVGVALLVLGMALARAGFAQAPAPAAAAAAAAVSFEKDIAPVLARRCQPCHFPGGKMYAKLPFDDPATVRQLGEKLFTRIKDPKEQELFRTFLASGH
jgi:hypothetical protein